MVFRRNPPDHEALRQLAMARLSGRGATAGAVALDEQQVRQLLEELEIRQIELELQNEHLNTARAQLELALNQSNELYDFSPVGSLLIDTDGSITRLNLRGAQLLDCERARLLGRKLGLYVAEDQRTQFNAMLARARAEHEAQTGDLMLQVDAHEPLPVQAKVVWIGPTIGWQVALVDISERRRMEMQLQASEARLALALEAVGDGMWDWQVNSGEVLVSDGYFGLLGLSSNKLSHPISKLIENVHLADRPKVMQTLQDCVIGKNDRFHMEHRLLCRDGSTKWVLARGTVVLRSASGGAERIIGTLVDISQKKRAEVDLAAAAQFQQAVFDSISAQIAVLDRDGMIVQTNAEWRSYAKGLGCEDSVGKAYLTVLPELVTQDQQTAEAVATGLAAVAAGELPRFYSSDPVHCPCGGIWFTIKITPVHDASKRMVVTHEDVSNLKRAELASLALANVDSLTGALSRQHFMSLAGQELARSLRLDLRLVLLVIDLDHFKRINDNHGHPAGDEVLRGFVKTVKGILHKPDLLGRFGGGEFAVLLPGTTLEGGCALANRIIAEIRSSPAAFNGERIAYTVSIGACELSGQASFAELLAQCDLALYRAKHGGRDRLEVCRETALPQGTGQAPHHLAA